MKITIILDKSQRKQEYSALTFLQNHNIPVLIDAKHAIAHNKIMVIDETTIITGSFNFTKAAEDQNAENLLIIDGDPALCAKYKDNFQFHASHSEQ